MKYLLIIFLIPLQIACNNTHKIDSVAYNNLVKKTQKAFQKNPIQITTLKTSRGFACEPSIFINPKNPSNIIAGSVLDDVYYTLDNGNSWQNNKLNSPYGVFGDPCVVIDKEGMAYYIHLSNPKKIKNSDGAWLDRIVINKSLNEGKSWDSGTGIGHNKPKQQDKAWAAINPENNSNLVVTWTEFDKYNSKLPVDKSRIRFSQSFDKGKTWTPAITISEQEGSCIDDDLTPEGAVPVIDNEGNINVAWAYDNKIWFNRSTNNGKTWFDKEIAIANQPKGWNIKIPKFGRANGMPILAVDNSASPFSGTLYVNWADQRNGTDNTDIFISKSVNQGKTWTKPLRVNIDKTLSQQWFTWMSVDPKTGFIYIIYYDRSAHKDFQTDVVLALSTDGGTTFSSRVVSETPFLVNKGKIYFMGDYNNINAYDNKVALIWTRADKDKTSVKAAVMDLK